jgi:hypothetical protein
MYSGQHHINQQQFERNATTTTNYSYEATTTLAQHHILKAATDYSTRITTKTPSSNNGLPFKHHIAQI